MFLFLSSGEGRETPTGLRLVLSKDPDRVDVSFPPLEDEN
jgi:hypothetical protein